MQKFLSIILLACVALAQTQNQIDFGAEDREEQDRLQACLFYQCSFKFVKKHVYIINLRGGNLYNKTSVVPASIRLEKFSRPKARKFQE